MLARYFALAEQGTSVATEVRAALVTFSVMLSDFFDTIGTIIGVGGRAGCLDSAGRLPRAGRVLFVDSIGAAFGGYANASSNTTSIESAAGVAHGDQAPRRRRT